MKILLGGLLVLSLALNIFLWNRISNQASQLKSAQANANETEELRRQNNELRNNQASAPDAASADVRELVQLRNQIGLLRKQAGESDLLRTQAAEAAQLRAQLASATRNLVSAQSTLTESANAKAKEDESKMCVNNLKQIGLAARIWAGDNNDVFPPDFISMKNELGTPKILFCPADTAAIPSTDWAQLNPAFISYRFMNPGGTEENPEKVLAICPIHGHVCMSDGSVRRKQ